MLEEYYSALREKFPKYPDSDEFNIHLMSHQFNKNAIEGKIDIRFCFHFIMDEIEFTCYSLGSDQIEVFGTIYHQYIGYLSKNHTWEILRKNFFVMGYFINFEKLKKKLLTMLRMAKLKYLLSIKTSQKIYFLTSISPNLGHHIWNEQSGLDVLVDLKLMKSCDGICFGQYDFFNTAKYFEELFTKDKVKYPKIENLTSSNIFLKSNELVFTERTRRRLCRNLGIEQNLQRPEEIVVIQTRRHNRLWLNELSELPKLIVAINKINPNLSFYLDGFSRFSIQDKNTESKILVEEFFFQHIKRSLPSNINFCSLIGLKIIEKINIISKSKIIIGPIGSGGLLGGWLLNKPIISFGPHSYYNWTSSDAMSVVEYPRKDWIYVPKEKIQMSNNNLDFSLSYEHILNLVEKSII